MDAGTGLPQRHAGGRTKVTGTNLWRTAPASKHTRKKCKADLKLEFPALFDVVTAPAVRPNPKAPTMGVHLVDTLGAVKQTLALRWACLHWTDRSSFGIWPLIQPLRGLLLKLRKRATTGKSCTADDRVTRACATSPSASHPD